MYLILIFLSISSVFATVTEPEFIRVTGTFSSRVKPLADITVTTDWKKEYSDASAGGSYYLLNGKTPAVHVTGWLARLPMVTTDTLDFVLCHETGHHRFGPEGEAESDDFTIRNCLPKVWGSGFSEARAWAAYKSGDELRNWMTQKRAHVPFADSACRELVVRDALAGSPFTDHCQ